MRGSIYQTRLLPLANPLHHAHGIGSVAAGVAMPVMRIATDVAVRSSKVGVMDLGTDKNFKKNQQGVQGGEGRGSGRDIYMNLGRYLNF